MDEKKNIKKIETAKWVVLGLSALAGFIFIIVLTSKWGIGTSPDSAAYLAGARNIINGNGLSLLYDSNGDHLVLWLPWEESKSLQVFPWPPFLPVVLSIFGFLNLDMIDSARFLNAALFGASIFIILFILKKYIRSIFILAFAAVYLIASRDMVRIYSNLWSEPLFIFLSLLGILLLIYFLEKNKILYILLSSLCFSLAFFTRTIGISLIALMVISVLFFSQVDLKKRIIYAAVSGLIGAAPFFTWTLRNRFLYDSSQTEFIYHPGQLEFYTRMFDSFTLWIFPSRIPETARYILTTILLILIFSLAIYVAKKRKIDDQYSLSSKIIGIFSFHAILYLAALLSARHFFNIGISLASSRSLLPAFISIFIVFLFLLKRFLVFYNNTRPVRAVAIILCGFLMVTTFLNLNAVALFRHGQGYFSSSWYYSETLAEAKRIEEPDVPIYTNEPSAVYLLMDRSSFIFPVKQNTHSDKKNLKYEEMLEKTTQEIIEKDGMIVFFGIGWNAFISEEELSTDTRFYLHKDTSDGFIFRVKD